MIHAEQIRPEQRRLLTAGTGADFQDRVALVVLVFRQQRQLDAQFEFGQPLTQRPHLVIGQCLDFGLVGRLRHLGCLGKLGLGAAQVFDAVDDRPELAILLRHLGKLAAAQPGAGQCLAQFRMPTQQLVEARFESTFHFTA